MRRKEEKQHPSRIAALSGLFLSPPLYLFAYLALAAGALKLFNRKEPSLEVALVCLAIGWCFYRCAEQISRPVENIGIKTLCGIAFCGHDLPDQENHVAPALEPV